VGIAEFRKDWKKKGERGESFVVMPPLKRGEAKKKTKKKNTKMEVLKTRTHQR